MAVVHKEYNFTDTLNDAVNWSALHYQLSSSVNFPNFIGVAQLPENASKDFRVDFNDTVDNETLLDAAIAAHDGQSLPEGTVINAEDTVSNGKQRVEVGYWERLPIASNSLASYLDVLSVTTDPLPVGKYEIKIEYLFNVNSTSRDIVTRMDFDGETVHLPTTPEMHRQEMQNSSGTFSSTGSDQKLDYSHTFKVDVDSEGAKVIKFQMASSSSGTRASVFLSKIWLYAMV